LEITDGSIVLEFDQAAQYTEVATFCECHIVYNNEKANHIILKDELDEHVDAASASESLALFHIKNLTYVEIRDCSIESKSEKAAADSAFAMNERETLDNYKGILSVKSCNVKGFGVGFNLGPGSILSVEKSYLKGMRQAGIFGFNPKILKLSGSIVEELEGRGVDLLFKPSKAAYQRRILLEDNKI